ncbi:hypothetical protein HMPREF9013_1019 [Bulleidia extructa W1219]|uniref:Uncharacterized protein n=1 Tax=Bulleidia extructa W1219 TaxID=679192 RepID=D2MMN7_9FIRM|nr:hypothetical protein HMPREF9013_1019 [Bulleidia extructa W1219]
MKYREWVSYVVFYKKQLAEQLSFFVQKGKPSADQCGQFVSGFVLIRS